MTRKIPVDMKLFVGGGSLRHTITIRLEEELTAGERRAWQENLTYSDVRWKDNSLVFTPNSGGIFDHRQLLRPARNIRDRLNLEIVNIESEGCRLCEGSGHIRHKRPSTDLTH